MRVSEIRVNQICVNQGLGVQKNGKKINMVTYTISNAFT